MVQLFQTDNLDFLFNCKIYNLTRKAVIDIAFLIIQTMVLLFLFTLRSLYKFIRSFSEPSCVIPDFSAVPDKSDYTIAGITNCRTSHTNINSHFSFLVQNSSSIRCMNTKQQINIEIVMYFSYIRFYQFPTP